MLCCTSNLYAIKWIITLVADPTSEHGFAIVKPSDAAARPLRPVQLEELLGRGAHGSTWRARLADGTRVAVKRLATYGEHPSDFFERFQRAAEVHHPHLLDVIWTLEEDGEFWVVSRLCTGVALSAVLKNGRMRSSCAVVVGMGVLSALTALHQAGLWHGAVHGRNVLVDRDGTVRLGDHCLTPPPAGQASAALRAADVRAVGALVCSMLGVPLEPGAATDSRRASKAATSALGLAAKAIAGPPRKLPAGYEAAHASLTLWEAARKVATSRRQTQARQDLAAMVAAALEPARPARPQARRSEASSEGRRRSPAVTGSRSRSAAVPDLPGKRERDIVLPAPGPAERAPLEPAGSEPGRSVLSSPVASPAPVVRPSPAESRRPRRLSMAWAPAVAAGLVITAAAAVFAAAAPHPVTAPTVRPRPVPHERGGSALIAPRPTLGGARAPAPPAPVAPTAPGAATLSPSQPLRTPPPPPPLPPSSAGDVLSVATDAQGCSPGGNCVVRVDVAIQAAQARRPVSWTLSSIDSCTAATVGLATSTVIAQPGWTRVVGFSAVTLPPGASQIVVAVTDTPARAASPAVRVGAPNCS